jgi:hypothetical protein
VLESALGAVSGELVAGVAAVVGCDMAVAMAGSGHETRGCRACRGAVGRFGIVCRRFSAVACGLGRGRAGDSTVIDKCVDGDVAVILHVSGCSTGDRGTGWGEWGAV